MDKENQNEPSTVDGILRKIEEKANSGEYIYRGESKHFGQFLQTSIASFLNTRL